MGRLCLKAAECNYKEHDSWLKEQFIGGINDEEITQELIRAYHLKEHELNRQ